MGLAHTLGLDDGGERWLCTSCGRFVTIEAEDDVTDEGPDAESDDVPTCPNCGSREMRRLALL